MSGSHLSKDFFELVKSIGESKSKQEEDRIIVHEVANLKRKLNETPTQGNSNNTTNKKRAKEFLIRIMYVEMLGHDASFGYIKAVELTASTNLLQKRIGYLACSLVLSPEHEFRFMIINQLQRDLQSSNHLEVCSALMAVCKLVTVEMIPAVQPMILDLLRHDADIVRKKAVMALHRCHQLNPDTIADCVDKLRRTLCDRDPSVMGAALCILHDLAVVEPAEYKDLVPSYVSILKQITEHRLPREFDYHRIPAPWIQIRLLKILALLGQADQSSSEGMYEVLHDVMRRADTGINVGYAIIYECVHTVTTIYPNTTLLDAAAASISRFISSENHNLKYLGVTGLAAIVKDHPRYASAHQMAVIDCLEDPDETLKRQTLDLLYRMTNPVNVEFISDKLTQYLREATDVYLRTELVERITQSAERYAPSNAWYIQTMTNVFELGGELVSETVAHNLLRLIAEGAGEDEEQDVELRRDAVATYLDLLDRPVLPDVLVRVMCWVLGEYGYLSQYSEDGISLEELCERLSELMDRPFTQEETTRGYIVTALLKNTAQLSHLVSPVAELVKKYQSSQSTDLQQRCLEFSKLSQNLSLMQQVLPVDASCEEIEVDPNLEFLNTFVQEALDQGAPRYSPPCDSDEEQRSYRRSRGTANIAEGDNALNFEAYEKPELPIAGPMGGMGGNISSGTHDRWGVTAAAQAPPNSQNHSYNGTAAGWNHDVGVNAGASGGRKASRNVWGPAGLNTEGIGGATGVDQYDQSQRQSYSGAPANKVPTEEYRGNTYAYDNNTQLQVPVSQGYQMENEEEEEEEEEEELAPDERQVMASALFGGLPGSKATAPAAARRNKSINSNHQSISSHRRSNSNSSFKQHRNSGSSNQRRPVNSGSVPSAALSSASAPAIDLLDMSFDASPSASVNSIGSDPFGTSQKAAPPSGVASLDPFNMGGMNSKLNEVYGSSNSDGNIPPTGNFNGHKVSPWAITTAEFGSRWGSCVCEKKMKISPTTVRTLDEYMNRMKVHSIHPVEAITQTNEAIAACRVDGSDLVCLLHTKIRTAGFLDLTIRSTDNGLTDYISSFVSQALK